jgi:hypothetical protein
MGGGFSEKERHPSIDIACGGARALLLVPWAFLQPAQAASPAQGETPQLTISKTVEGDGTIAPGGTVRFNITISNTGSITATNVVVQDDYDEAAFPTIEAGASGAQNDGQTIVWQVGDLLPGEGWSTSYAATAASSFGSDTTTISNDAVVYVEGEEIARSAAELSVRAPQLTLTRVRERVDHGGRSSPARLSATHCGTATTAQPTRPT